MKLYVKQDDDHEARKIVRGMAGIYRRPRVSGKAIVIRKASIEAVEDTWAKLLEIERTAEQKIVMAVRRGATQTSATNNASIQSRR
jgi:hypothetical protein